MACRAPSHYRDLVVNRALKSLLVEPPASQAVAPLRRDWILVAAVVAVGVLEAIVRNDVRWPGVVLVAVVAPAICLPWRRTHPFVVTAVVYGSILLGDAVTLLGTSEPTELYTAAYLLLIPYALFRWGSGVQVAAGTAIVVAAQVLLAAMTGSFDDLALALAFMSLAAALGASMRYRASSRLAEADRIRLREREQLARELHDTVAHHVSAIAIQAQAGPALAPSRPEAAVDALEVIEEAASRTLVDMRALVGTLRDGDEAALAPQRGVADVERLAHGRPDGPPVDVQLVGDLDDLPPLVGAAIYRIAQESVTNAVRHSNLATRIDVRVTGHDDCVRLVVRDDGEPVSFPADRSMGYGLVGMCERAALLGGTLDTGAADRGWVVTAVLPRDGRPR